MATRRKKTTKRDPSKKRTASKAGTKTRPRAAASKQVTAAQALKKFDEKVKAHGIVDVMEMQGDESLQEVMGWVSTQSLALDGALMAPGLPRGRIVEVYGEEGTGKSTLTDHIMASVQRAGGIAHLIEPESAKDLAYSRRIGLQTDSDKFRWYQPKENVLEVVMAQVEDIIEFWKDYPHIPQVVVVDSIAATPCRAELEGSIAEGIQPGLAARVLHGATRRLIHKISASNVLVVFVNQVYTKIGVRFGNPMKPYGGNALAFAASVRLQLLRGTAIEYPPGHPIGMVIHAKVTKSKVSPATGNKVDFALIHNVGIDNTWTIYNDFQRLKWITAGGGWNQIIIPGEAEPRRWQKTFVGLGELCKQDPDLFAKLASMHLQWRNPPPEITTPQGEEAD